jgi:carbonic anhydrase
LRSSTKVMQSGMTPLTALHLLQEGNERFVHNLKINRNLLQQASDTSSEQHPFAIILSCIDSRTSVEIVFDQGLGDVFNARIAGTIINEDILGSLEFACKVAGAKIIVVLGHSKCGAIRGACDNVAMGNLTALLSKIQPAIRCENTIIENRNSCNEEFVEKVTAINVQKSVQAVMERSPILKELIEKGECGIVGGKHDICTGKVSFYQDTKYGFFDRATKPDVSADVMHFLKSKL